MSSFESIAKEIKKRKKSISPQKFKSKSPRVTKAQKRAEDELKLEKERSEAQKIKDQFEQEEIERIKFLNKIKTISDPSKIVSQMQSFSDDGDSHREIFVDMIKLIPSNKIEKYINSILKYFKSSEYSTLELLTIVKDNEKLLQNYDLVFKEKYGSIDDLIQKETEFIKKKTKSFMSDRDYEQLQRTIERLKTVRQTPKRSVKLLDAKGDIVEISPPPKRTIYTYVQQCVDGYNQKVWIKDYDNLYYIASVDNKLPEAFIQQDKNMIIDNDKYYQSTKSFDIAMCTGKDKVQEKNVLYFEKDGKQYRVKIIYKLKSGEYLKQNEELFKKEQEWVNLQKMSIKKQIDTFATYPVKEYSIQVRQFGIQELSKFFDKDSSILLEQAIFDDTKDKTINNYVKQVGKLVIFLDSNYLKNLANGFNTKLALNYYDINSIINISPKEILQDIYNNPKNDENKINRLNSDINQNLELYTMNKLNNIYLSTDSTRKSHEDVLSKQTPMYLENLNKSLCINDIGSENEWDILYYVEDGKVYCLKILELVKRISDNNLQNPYTNKILDQEFIEHIKKYSEEDVEKEFYKQLFGEEQEVPRQETEVFPNIKKIILNDINSLEYNMMKKLSKDTTCKYYQQNIFIQNETEKLLNKPQEMIQEMKIFCEEKPATNVVEEISNEDDKNKKGKKDKERLLKLFEKVTVI